MQGILKKKLKTALMLVALLAAFCVGWYAVGRLTSPWRAIRVRSLAASETATDAHAPAELRIATYNIAHGRGLAASNWRGGGTDARLARLWRASTRPIGVARLKTYKASPGGGTCKSHEAWCLAFHLSAQRDSMWPRA
jgi:hypothetical protein